jgi:predicted DNA-binding protein with PD1-like motif
MYSALTGSNIAVRLHAGEDVHAGLVAACTQYGITAAFVVSGIGMLADPLLGWYEVEALRYHEQRFPGRHELLSLAGNISLKDGAPFGHLHAVLGHTNYSCFGGHLFSATVGLTLEVLLITLSPEVTMRRELEAEFGLPGLVVEGSEAR